MKKSLVSPSFLKQKARQLKKEKSITQRQALDEAVKEFGYTNYKNYLNVSNTNRKQLELLREVSLHSLWTDKEIEISKKLDLLIPQMENLKISFEELLANLKESRKSKTVIQSICEKAGLNEYLNLYLLIDSLRDENCEIDDYAPYHIAKGISLKNLIYKFKNDMLHVEGEYDLKLEFAFEYDKDDKDDFFQEREMFGDFELTVDRNGEINFEDSNIGYYL